MLDLFLSDGALRKLGNLSASQICSVLFVCLALNDVSTLVGH